MNRIIMIFLVFASFILHIQAQHQGDTVSVGNTKFVLLSQNLISNPGFEDGFTGWTDATPSTAQLSSAYFSLTEPGGIDNSKFLVGTTNSSSASAGSIGTGWSIEPDKTYYFSYNVKYLNASTAAVPEVWLKVSLTNDPTSNAEPSILIDTTTVNGGGVWTKNAVGFTNTFPYNNIVARFRWLNNRFGFDNFALHEAYEIPDSAGLQSTIQQAQDLYDASSAGAQDLQDAITSAEGLLTSTSAIEVRLAISNLKDAMFNFKLANAGSSEPLDMTSIITNPSFESGFTGWTNDGFATQSNTVFPGKDGSLYAEKWVNRGTRVPDVSVQQQLNDIPNGHYTMTAICGNIQQTGSGSSTNVGNAQTGASLFAGDYAMAADTIKLRSVSFFVFDNQVTIGYKTVNATGNWVTCDNFRLLYKGYDVDAIKSYLQILVDTANVLLGSKMQDNVRAELVASVNLSEQAIADQNITKDSLSNIILNIQSSSAGAKTSITAYNNLQNVIDLATTLYGDGSGNEATALQTAINAATAIVNDLNASLTQIETAAKDMDRATLVYRLANATGPAPVVVTNPMCLRGATKAFGRSTIAGFAVSGLLEHGFCWSTSPNPTVLDNRTNSYFSHNGYIYKMENLTPSTVYYVRAYAMTKDYAVGYGDVLKVITIPKGTATYWYNYGGPDDADARIAAALEEATDYRNNLTSIKGLHITCSYGSGTPTADCSYGGSMRIGPNSAYQRTGTVLHEMEHAMGVGTHWMWYGPNSVLRSNGSRGLWLGDRANNVVRFLENSNAGTVTGDAVHMWSTGFASPLNYGINGAQEDDGSELLYTANSLLIQALCEDGLIPTSGFSLPAYTLDTEDTIKYYLKSENAQTGRDDAFVVLEGSGNLVNRVMTAGQALVNDSAAWTFTFNPVNCYYTIKNVATGRYFTYRSTGSNGISTVSRSQPYSADYFQLMEARVETKVGDLTKKGYWIIHPEAKSSPACLTAVATEVTSTSGFNIANTSTTQRWLLLSSGEVEQLDQTTPVTDLKADHKSDMWVYSENRNLHIENIIPGSDVIIYDISGAVRLRTHELATTFTHKMPEGIYFVAVRSDKIQQVKKVIVK
ncbi:T9SS type A sorting domain-containing protein [Saccharicrinis sp. FJH2]|uniref:T9SS type A sorting domain-containing protein n=1 Tax=Saccharicrinis sp. FJH65 TaxID=3344659 RepID=UPI0035F48B2B